MTDIRKKQGGKSIWHSTDKNDADKFANFTVVC